MPYRRRRTNGGGRRRFFRRSRPRFRPTTQSGSGRLARCHINTFVSADVSSLASTLIGNYRRLAGMRQLIAGFPAGDVRDAMSLWTLPLRGFDIVGLRLDCDVFCGQHVQVPSSAGVPYFLPEVLTYQFGMMIMTQKETADGLPMGDGTFPPMDMSQWPVNVDNDEHELTEDSDYATRIHYQKSGFLRPDQFVEGDGVGANTLAPGRTHQRWSCRVKVNRRIPDGYGLYLGTWTSTPNGSQLDASTCEFSFTGDLWYRLSR